MELKFRTGFFYIIPENTDDDDDDFLAELHLMHDSYKDKSDSI
jgi:hypothetical protein